MKRRILITGYGVVSALGIGKEISAKNLYSGQTYITKQTMLYRDQAVTSSFGAVTEPLGNENLNLKIHDVDRVIKLAIKAADEALSQSDILKTNFDPLRVGVVIGTSLGGMLSGDRFHSQWLNEGLETADSELLKQYPLHAVADAVAAQYGFNGTRIVVSTACSSGANALGVAHDLIDDNICDVVITGGVDPLSRFSFAGFSALGAINSEPCQPYSNSCGINIGEGAAFFVIESEKHMLDRDGDSVCEFLGYGLSADAYHPTAPDISGNGAIRSMYSAVKNAGISTGEISYINGHGTGTPANDSAEKKIWKGFVKDHTNIPMISNKGAIGHCMGAAGAIEVALSILSLKSNMIPPTLNFDMSAEQTIDFVPNSPQKAEVNVVISNSFAFGGNNCSIIIGDNSSQLISRDPTDTDTDDVVITGIGCVGIGGNSIAEFFESLRSGGTKIEHIDTSEKPYNVQFAGLAKVDDSYFKKHIQSGKLRRIDRITKLAMSSGRQALLDSKLIITPANSSRVGVIYGTGSGPSSTIRSINESIVRIGISGVATDMFPNSVLNAAPGQFSIANNIKGVTSTLSSGNTTALNAIIYASMLLKNNQADAIVVISADEWDESLQVGNEKLGLLSFNGNLPFSVEADGMILSEGSVAFVLERSSHAKMRKAVEYASVDSYFSVSSCPDLSCFENKGIQWQCGFERMLKTNRIDTIDAYVSLSPGNRIIEKQEVAMANSLFPNANFYSLTRMIGTPFGSVGAYGLLTAIYCLKNNEIPSAGNLDDTDEQFRQKLEHRTTKNNFKYAATSVAAHGGGYAGVVLRKNQ